MVDPDSDIPYVYIIINGYELRFINLNIVQRPLFQNFDSLVIEVTYPINKCKFLLQLGII